jgi:hypothetical protein
VSAPASPADPLIHRADRLERDAAVLRRAAETPPPDLTWSDGSPVIDPRDQPGYEPGDVTVDGIALAGAAYPEPVDCGHLTLSVFGGVAYVADLVIPGRIHIVAAEEGTGKTYAGWELSIRMSAAGGSFAGTWPIEVAGPVAYLSEMHADDDYSYQQDILEALELDRSALVGKLYRLDLGTAANGAPVLTDPDWRAWFTAWCRRRGIRLAVFDTGTGATQVDPWGKAIQQVYRDLRVMLADCPELAVVLLLHLKKPQGRGTRRISDVLGEWGRWCDVLILMEADGDTKTKVSTHKRIRHHKRIVATRAGGLLIEPQDITDAKPAQKVSPEAVLAKAVEMTGRPRADLAKALGVSEKTLKTYLAGIGEDRVRTVKGTASKGPEAQIRVVARFHPSDPWPEGWKWVETSVLPPTFPPTHEGDGGVGGRVETHPIGGAFHFPSTHPPSSDSLSPEDDYPASAWDPEAAA